MIEEITDTYMISPQNRCMQLGLMLDHTKKFCYKDICEQFMEIGGNLCWFKFSI
jgi:hypothetical protein